MIMFICIKNVKHKIFLIIMIYEYKKINIFCHILCRLELIIITYCEIIQNNSFFHLHIKIYCNVYILSEVLIVYFIAKTSHLPLNLSNFRQCIPRFPKRTSSGIENFFRLRFLLIFALQSGETFFFKHSSCGCR